MINECIILAGGLGTRLRDEVPGYPQSYGTCPATAIFIVLFTWLKKNNIKRVILSLGYRAEVIIEWCHSQ